MVLETHDPNASYTEEISPTRQDQFEEFEESHLFVLSSDGQSSKMKSSKQESISCLGVNATEASYQKGKS